MAEAPRTAALEPSSPLTRNFALPLNIFNTFSSYARFIGSISKSPAFVSPPKKINASGEEKAVKSEHASPSISPVNSYMRLASASPLPADIDTSSDVISSLLSSRSNDGSSVVSSISRAVRATPVAEQ